jgi:hypothetical protein
MMPKGRPTTRGRPGDGASNTPTRPESAMNARRRANRLYAQAFPEASNLVTK